MANLTHFTVDELYYGSTRVHLRHVPGRSVAYIHDAFVQAEGETAVALHTSRKTPFFLEDGEQQAVVPNLPAPDWILREGDSSTHKEANAAHLKRWPEFLQMPAIKIPGEGGPWAVASGVRSCIVRLDGEMFRLKGSGNNDEGFIVNEQLKTGVKEVRGCAFEHTATVENHWVTELASSLEPLGISGANEALGWWEYDDPNRPLGPRIQPVCIVQRTHGDRRLGTHVMQGLERILEMFVDVEELTNQSALLATFPRARPLDNGVPVPTCELTADYMISFHEVVNSTGDIHHLEIADKIRGLCWDSPRDNTFFANTLALELPQRSPDPEVLPNAANPRWGTLWRETCNRLQVKLLAMEGKPGPSVLAYLFNRIGVECGEVLRAMHDRGVSWGTYHDSICVNESQLHCNAHSNNLIALSPTSAVAEKRFLGYLDLDMAFEVDKVVPGVDDMTPEMRLGVEYVGLLECLSGGDTSSGVTAMQRAELRDRSPSTRLLSTALQDTMVLGYISGYTRESSQYAMTEWNSALHKAAQDVIALAIIAQADAIA